MSRILPVLFNTEMVRAILDDRKTVTRRIMKPQPTLNGHFWELGGAGWSDNILSLHPMPCHSLYNRMPFHTGDILYVRETWAHIPCIDCCADEQGQCSERPIIYEDRHSVSEGCFIYREDYPEQDSKRVCWSPSIHMPKQAARIWLRVTDVRVERLQEITEEQAKAEGICEEWAMSWWRPTYADPDSGGFPRYRDTFAKDLWDYTIKKSDLARYGWDANPWVFVIEFERIEKDETM